MNTAGEGDATQSILNRIARLEGQIHGIGKMVAAGRQCDQVLLQVAAARAALEKVAVAIMAVNIDECLTLSPDEARKALTRSVALLNPK